MRKRGTLLLVFWSLTAAITAQGSEEEAEDEPRVRISALVDPFSLEAPAAAGLAAGNRNLFWNQSQQRPTTARRDVPPGVFSKTGYIDNAIVSSQVRVRFDAGFDLVAADRAEFFYAKCGCYRELAAVPGFEAFADPNAPGPAPALNGRSPVTTPFIETGLDFQDLTFTFEYAPHRRFSFLFDLPIRSVDPNINADETGLGDVRAGFKVALAASENQYLTFQFQGYFPTGEGEEGLGTEHTSLEPGLIYYQRLSKWIDLAGEFRYWIPVNGSSTRGLPVEVTEGDDDFAGDILRYGFGVGINATPDSHFQVAPVVEVVAWSVLDGFRTVTADGTGATFRPLDADASGDNIVNLKLGARMSLRDSRGSFYIGYGKALTDETWYDDIIRVEYRFVFQ